jgi:hypothetical protein
LKKGDLGGFKNQQSEEIFGKRYSPGDHALDEKAFIQ